MRRLSHLGTPLLAAAIAAGGACRRPPAAVAPATRPAPATAASTRPDADGVARSYGWLVAAHYPLIATTQPAAAVGPEDAAHLRFDEPIYVDFRGRLWITRPDAPRAERVLADPDAMAAAELVVRDRVAFVAERVEPGSNDARVVLVCRTDDGGYERVTRDGRDPLPFARRYDWARANAWGDRVVVPADAGASVLTLGYIDREHSPLTRRPAVPPADDYHDLRPAGAAALPTTSRTTAATKSDRLAPAEIAFDAAGFLAWLPADEIGGPTRVARYVDGKWADLDPSAGWGGEVIHLIPLLDGSVVQVRRDLTPAPAAEAPAADAVPRADVALAGDAPSADRENPGNTDKPRLAAPLAGRVGVPSQRDPSAPSETTAQGDAPERAPQAGRLNEGKRGDAAVVAPESENNAVSADDRVVISVLPLDAQPVDPGEVSKLVAQLSDDDAEVRRKAFEALGRYGPGLWPVIDALPADPSPEGQARLAALRATSVGPRLGGMTVNDDRLRVVARLRDGGVALLAPAGVSIPQPDGQARVVSPDVIVVRPGAVVRELPRPLWDDVPAAQLRPGGVYQLHAIDDEWLVTKDDAGPQRFTPPGGLAPLLRTGELDCASCAGLATMGRWVFQRPGADAGGAAPTGTTLVLDPTLPDPQPRIAVWHLDTKQPAGWDEHDWPAITRLGDPWAITATDWNLLDRRRASSFRTRVAGAGPARPTAGASRPAEAPLWTDADGTAYTGGHDELTVRPANGPSRTWPLPSEARGDASTTPQLLRAPSGSFFLYNRPGRLTQLRLQGGAGGAFVLERVYTDGIPIPRQRLQRLWLDPAGRIDWVYDETQLAVLFPTGRIPPPLAEKMLPQDVFRSISE